MSDDEMASAISENYPQFAGNPAASSKPAAAPAPKASTVPNPVAPDVPAAASSGGLLDAVGGWYNSAKKAILDVPKLAPGQEPGQPAPGTDLMAGAKGGPDLSDLPVTPEYLRAMQAQWNAATPAQRRQLAERKDHMGVVARRMNEARPQLAAEEAPDTLGILGNKGVQLDTTSALDQLDPTAEARTRRLIRGGVRGDLAGAEARVAAARDIPVGAEASLRSSASVSDFDFATFRKFNEDPFWKNPVVRGAVKGYEGYKQGILGMNQAIGEAVGADVSGQAALAKDSRGFTEAMGESPDYLQRNFEGTISSIAQQLPALIGGAASGSEGLVLGSMFAQSFGQEYSDSRAKGQEQGAALTRAGLFGAFEVVGEKLGLGERLQILRNSARGVETNVLAKWMANTLKEELPGEMLTTTGQFLTDKLPGIGMAQNAGLADYLQQMGDTVTQTIMQGGLMSAGTGGVNHARGYLNGAFDRGAEHDANAAQRDALNAWNTNGLSPGSRSSGNAGGSAWANAVNGGAGPAQRREPTLGDIAGATSVDEAIAAATAVAAAPASAPASTSPFPTSAEIDALEAQAGINGATNAPLQSAVPADVLAGLGGRDGAAAPVPTGLIAAADPAGQAGIPRGSDPASAGSVADSAAGVPGANGSADASQALSEAQSLSHQWDTANRSSRGAEWIAGAAESNQAFKQVEQDGAAIPAHGMAKAATVTQALKNLIDMLNGGIDPTRTLYYDSLTNPHKGAGAATGTGGGVAYRDGPFIITFREGLNGRQPMSADITGVLVNPAHSELVAPLQRMFPQLAVRDYHQVADVVTASRAAAGKETDDSRDWHRFPPESQTLGIPRAQMPQIKAEHRGAMVNFLNARGISHEQVDVDANELKPTQQEFSISKVQKAIEHQGGNRSILISSDNYVLDGHHQWLAAAEKGETISAIRLNAPIRQLVDAVHEFPSSTVDTSSAAAPSKAAPAPSAVPSAAPKQTGGQRARERVARENPFLGFLANHGVKIDERSDTGGQKGRAGGVMVPGYGPLYRKGGKRLDELAQLAHEAGFLSQQDIDNPTDTGGTRKLADMIQRAAHSKEVLQPAGLLDAIAPTADQRLLEEAQRLGIETDGKTSDQLYDAVTAAHAAEEGRRETSGASNVDEQDAIDHYADQFDMRDVVDAQLNDDDIPFDLADARMVDSNNLTDEEIDAKFGIQKAASASESSGEAQTGAAGTPGQGTARAGEPGQEGQDLLTSYTAGDVLEREDAAAARAKAVQAERDKLEARRKAEQDAKDNRARADASVDDFQLGQDAHAQLSGQRGMFDEPAPAPAAKPKQEEMERQEFDSSAGVGKISAVKQRYDDKFGVSWASTNIATADTMEEAAAIARAVAESGADNIKEMRRIGQDEQRRQHGIGRDGLRDSDRAAKDLDSAVEEFTIQTKEELASDEPITAAEARAGALAWAKDAGLNEGEFLRTLYRKWTRNANSLELQELAEGLLQGEAEQGPAASKIVPVAEGPTAQRLRREDKHVFAQPRIHTYDPAKARPVVLISCSEPKLEGGPHRAVDLYQGGLFDVLRKWMPANNRPDVFIISAKHGLVHADTLLEHYEQPMTQERLEALMRKGIGARDIGPKNFSQVFIAGSANYRELGQTYAERLRKAGYLGPEAVVLGSAAGAGIGTQRGDLADYLKQLEASATPETKRLADQLDAEAARRQRIGEERDAINAAAGDVVAQKKAAQVKTPGTNLVWSNLGDWLGAYSQLDGRAASSKRHVQLREHVGALVRNPEKITGETDSRVLEEAKTVLERQQAPRGKREDDPATKAVQLIGTQLAKTLKQGPWNVGARAMLPTDAQVEHGDGKTGQAFTFGVSGTIESIKNGKADVRIRSKPQNERDADKHPHVLDGTLAKGVPLEQLLPPGVEIDDGLLGVAKMETANLEGRLLNDLENDQQGVIVGKPTAINQSLAKGRYTLDDIAGNYGRTRAYLRRIYGDMVTLYRAEPAAEKWHPDTQVVYMGDLDLAEKFRRDGRKFETYRVPVDDIVGLNVQKNGYYEFIVKRQGEPMAGASEPGKSASKAPETASEEGKSASEPGKTASEDTGADIPAEFYKGVTFEYLAVAGDELVDLPADEALAKTRDTIDQLEAMLKCMGA